MGTVAPSITASRFNKRKVGWQYTECKFLQNNYRIFLLFDIAV
jgi:hypothetical protein